LRFRERIKEEKQFELHAVLLEQARLEEEIRSLESRLENVGVAASTPAGQTYAAFELKFQDDYAQLLDKLIEQKRAALNAFRETVRQKQQEVAEAAREVKTLELLRQRRAEKFRLWQNAEEQKFIDEIGQRKFTRRGGRQ
jgi:flagellar export protein FliJ